MLKKAEKSAFFIACSPPTGLIFLSEDDYYTAEKSNFISSNGSVIAWSDKCVQSGRVMYCTETFRCYVAKINGKPCAWATSFIENEYAILANAYTQEAYRSNGCQTALLRARIEEAIGLGVKVILTDVMPNSISSKNCKSVGFTKSGTRSVWCKG